MASQVAPPHAVPPPDSPPVSPSLSARSTSTASAPSSSSDVTLSDSELELASLDSSEETEDDFEVVSNSSVGASSEASHPSDDDEDGDAGETNDTRDVGDMHLDERSISASQQWTSISPPSSGDTTPAASAVLIARPSRATTATATTTATVTPNESPASSLCPKRGRRHPHGRSSSSTASVDFTFPDPMAESDIVMLPETTTPSSVSPTRTVSSLTYSEPSSLIEAKGSHSEQTTPVLSEERDLEVDAEVGSQYLANEEKEREEVRKEVQEEVKQLKKKVQADLILNERKEKEKSPVWPADGDDDDEVSGGFGSTYNSVMSKRGKSRAQSSQESLSEEQEEVEKEEDTDTKPMPTPNPNARSNPTANSSPGIATDTQHIHEDVSQTGSMGFDLGLAATKEAREEKEPEMEEPLVSMAEEAATEFDDSASTATEPLVSTERPLDPTNSGPRLILTRPDCGTTIVPYPSSSAYAPRTTSSSTSTSSSMRAQLDFFQALASRYLRFTVGGPTLILVVVILAALVSPMISTTNNSQASSSNGTNIVLNGSIMTSTSTPGGKGETVENAIVKVASTTRGGFFSTMGSGSSKSKSLMTVNVEEVADLNSVGEGRNPSWLSSVSGSEEKRQSRSKAKGKGKAKEVVIPEKEVKDSDLQACHCSTSFYRNDLKDLNNEAGPSSGAGFDGDASSLKKVRDCKICLKKRLSHSIFKPQQRQQLPGPQSEKKTISCGPACTTVFHVPIPIVSNYVNSSNNNNTYSSGENQNSQSINNQVLDPLMDLLDGILDLLSDGTEIVKEEMKRIYEILLGPAFDVILGEWDGIMKKSSEIEWDEMLKKMAVTATDWEYYSSWTKPTSNQPQVQELLKCVKEIKKLTQDYSSKSKLGAIGIKRKMRGLIEEMELRSRGFLDGILDLRLREDDMKKSVEELKEWSKDAVRRAGKGAKKTVKGSKELLRETKEMVEEESYIVGSASSSWAETLSKSIETRALKGREYFESRSEIRRERRRKRRAAKGKKKEQSMNEDGRKAKEKEKKKDGRKVKG